MNAARTKTVFVVEDDAKIAALVRDYLQNSGYIVRIFVDGRDVISSVRANPPDALILDRMLPAGDGMAICAGIRKFSAIPIMMLTARVEESDILAGLECGADDYVTKPFSARQLVAKIAALIRRVDGHLETNASAQPFWIDEEGKRVAWRAHWLALSASEFQILSVLMQHPERIYSRNKLLDHLGERTQESGDRAIDSHIKNIRRKIAAVDPHASCITSVYGAGYRFTPSSGKRS